jgi:hypothetical protein
VSRDKYAGKARKARKADQLSRQCFGKHAYDSPDEAADGIPSTQRFYQCRNCGRWHRATKAEAKLAWRIRQTPRRRP